MSPDPHTVSFAEKAKPLSEEDFARQAHQSGDLYRFIWSVWFFNPGWSWTQAKAEVLRLMTKYPKG
jgi:hypothetical protein